MNLRVLLIESEAEELLFLQDVLREIEDQRLLPEWSRIEPEYAATWTEVERMLSTSPPHAIFLDLNLGPNPSLDDRERSETFRSVQEAVPDVPVILLVDPGDEQLASRLMRDGAQDFLYKRQVDCAPLAHALRNAVLRHRQLAAARSASLTDALTGLTNRTGFLALAHRDRKLAERLGQRWMLLVAEPRDLAEIGLAFGQQRRDLELLEAAERLRGIATPADLVARIGDRHFAISIFDGEVESAEEDWMRNRNAAAEHRINIGACIFDANRPISLDAMLEQALADLPPVRSPKPRETTKVAGAA